jgi:hypothetical protein
VNRAFFITGLPRTRTCWLANLFTERGALCHHDLLGAVPDVPALVREMSSDTGRSVGDADSGLLFVQRWFKARWPDAPWLLVQRDFRQAWESLAAFVKGGPWEHRIPVDTEARDRLMQSYYAALPHFFNDKACMCVQFEELDSMAMLQRIWEHLRPEAPFDQRRARMLQTLRMEPCPAKHPLEANKRLIEELASWR